MGNNESFKQVPATYAASVTEHLPVISGTGEITSIERDLVTAPIELCDMTPELYAFMESLNRRRTTTSVAGYILRVGLGVTLANLYVLVPKVRRG